MLRCNTKHERILCREQGDPGIRGPMGNPGKEGPKVGKEASAPSAVYQIIIVSANRNKASPKFIPEKNTFHKITIWIISQRLAIISTSHYILCSLTVCARAGCCCYGYSVLPLQYGGLELRGGDILDFTPSSL